MEFLAKIFSIIPYKISRSDTRQLKNYRYNLVENSWLAINFYKPLWAFCADFVPGPISPNVVTIIGTILMQIGFALECYFNPDMNHPENHTQCSLFWMGFLYFLGHTFDGIDGKLARKRGQSSPVGELLDHTLDNTNFNAIIMMMIGGAYSLVTDLNSKFLLVTSMMCYCSTATFLKAFQDEFVMPHTVEATHMGISVVYFIYAWTGWEFRLEKNVGGYVASAIVLACYYTLFENGFKTFKAMQKYYAKASFSQVSLKLFGLFYPFLALYTVFYVYLQTLKNSDSGFQDAIVIRCFYMSMSLKNTLFYFRMVYYSIVSPEAMSQFGWTNKIHFYYLDVLVVNFLTCLKILEAGQICVLFLIYNVVSFFFTFFMTTKRISNHLNLNFIYVNPSKQNIE